MPFPLEPSMRTQPPKYYVVHISEVNKLKDTIKVLEKENVCIRSNVSRLTREKEDLKINLKQKKGFVIVAQVEHNKRRKVDKSLKGTFVILSIKKQRLSFMLAKW